jgi:hypothetical protein
MDWWSGSSPESRIQNQLSSYSREGIAKKGVPSGTMMQFAVSEVTHQSCDWPWLVVDLEEPFGGVMIVTDWLTIIPKKTNNVDSSNDISGDLWVTCICYIMMLYTSVVLP